ncbi:hypothetical protein EU537_11350 [Candidatus Thorarchaeota archaeon]|nr:MAG: hypothetical protein EU537_11350 [Candidatus Thorarchaeota archaeon]
MTSVQDISEILVNGENRNTEFKRKLDTSDLRKKRREKLVTRIRYMTCEAPFEGTFLVGIEDINGREWKVFGLTEQGLETSEDILTKICQDADVEIVEEERIETEKGLVGVYLLKRLAAPEVKETCSVNVAGRVNSGKSTLIGALVTGTPDNGSGKARSFLLKHPQEITRGQTADLHMSFMGFNQEGQSLHLQNPLNKEESARVLDESTNIVAFFDAPGHKEYSKTMIRSILGADAQYGLVLVPAPEEASLIQTEEERTGIQRLDDITREHLILMSNQDAPFMVIISKPDKAKESDKALVIELVKKTLKDIGKIPVVLRDRNEIRPVIREIEYGVIVPILEVAATEIDSLELLIELLSKLSAKAKSHDLSLPARAYVDKVYRGIRGTNVVVTGTVRAGVFKQGQSVAIGPDQNGKFRKGRLFSIEMFQKRVANVRAGDLFGFDIKDVEKHAIRRGQVVADPIDNLKSCKEFEANIVVTRHPTRITTGYMPVLQCNTIQTTVMLSEIYDNEFLSVGDFARVRLQFLRGYEAIELGEKIVLREANTRAIGTVVEILS